MNFRSGPLVVAHRASPPPRPRRMFTEGFGGLGILAVRAWPVWRQRRRVLLVLAVVEILAVAAPIVTWSPTTRGDLVLAGMLASLSVTYCLFVRGWEQARRLLALERTPEMVPDVLATWCFAAALLLPPTIAALVTAVAAAADWPVHPPGTKQVYRYTYSAMASVLASTVASSIFHGPMWWPIALLAASGAWLAIGAGATGLAMCASGQSDHARRLLHPDAHRIEVVTMSVAAAQLVLHMAGLALLIWLSLPIAVGIQRYFTRAEFDARPADAQPMSAEAWLIVSHAMVEACSTSTILRISTANLAAAHAVAKLQGGVDATGHFGDHGLGVLLPDCPPENGDAIARRLRVALDHHRVDCVVASASAPRDGQGLDDLLAVTEAELVAREAARPPASRSDRG